MIPCRRLFALVLAAALPSSRGESQSLSRSFLEFNVGLSAGDASVPNGPSRGIAGDVLLGFKPGRTPGGFVTAVSASGQTPMASIACDLVPGGTCPIDFPGFLIVAAHAGWETEAGRARILAGPALAISESDGNGAALQIRLELAAPLSGRLSVIGSGRFVYIPGIADRSFTLGAAGIGLRIR
jgi:hypothetical protein